MVGPQLTIGELGKDWTPESSLSSFGPRGASQPSPHLPPYSPPHAELLIGTFYPENIFYSVVSKVSVLATISRV